MPEPIILDEHFESAALTRLDRCRVRGEIRRTERERLDWIPEATFEDVAAAYERDARNALHAELADTRQEQQRSFCYLG